MGAGATIVSSVQQKRGGNISQSFSLFVFVVIEFLAYWIELNLTLYDFNLYLKAV